MVKLDSCLYTNLDSTSLGWTHIDVEFPIDFPKKKISSRHDLAGTRPISGDREAWYFTQQFMSLWFQWHGFLALTYTTFIPDTLW